MKIKTQPTKREMQVANGPGHKTQEREAQITIIVIPPTYAMLVMAAAHGVSSPDGGDQGLHGKPCSFRID